MKEEKNKNLKENLGDWLIYSIAAGIFLTPFLGGEHLKHIGASILVGFLFGMLNRIIRELDKLNNK